MFDKFYVGRDVTASANNGTYKPVSRVTLVIDDESSVTAGDDTGREIVANCPYATQEMVNALLVSMKGFEYQAYEADGANIDPSAELGDGVTVDGVYSVVANVRDNGGGYASISAPGEAELEDEYPMEGPLTQMINRGLKETGSRITKTAEEIRMEVLGVEENLTYLELNLDAITGRVTNIEGDIGTLELTADSLTGRIEDAEGNIGTLQLTATELRSEISGKIGESAAKTLIKQSLKDGITLSESSEDGSATLRLGYGEAELASNTFKLKVDAAEVSGVLKGTGNNLVLEGMLTLQDPDKTKYGAIGSFRGSTGTQSTYGAALMNLAYNGGFVVTEAGAKMMFGANNVYCDPSGITASSEIKVASDRTLKNSISYDLTTEERAFANLRPCSFVYNNDADKKRHWGFVAQDFVQGVEAVGMDADMLAVIGYHNGKYSIGYGEVTTLNTHMIQRLMERVEELEKKLEG